MKLWRAFNSSRSLLSFFLPFQGKAIPISLSYLKLASSRSTIIVLSISNPNRHSSLRYLSFSYVMNEIRICSDIGRELCLEGASEVNRRLDQAWDLSSRRCSNSLQFASRRCQCRSGCKWWSLSEQPTPPKALSLESSAWEEGPGKEKEPFLGKNIFLRYSWPRDGRPKINRCNESIRKGA